MMPVLHVWSRLKPITDFEVIPIGGEDVRMLCHPKYDFFEFGLSFEYVEGCDEIDGLVCFVVMLMVGRRGTKSKGGGRNTCIWRTFHTTNQTLNKIIFPLD